MDEHAFEQAIEEELEKLSVNLSDMGSDGSDSDTDIEEDSIAFNEKLENDLPDSVLAYFKASSDRVNTFEQLILEDLDDLETMCNEMLSPSQHADPLNKLGSNFDEDPLKLKERIMSEIEEQVGLPCETHNSSEDYDTESDTHKNSERQLMFEWRNLEERLRKEEKQRLAELEAEREQCLKSARGEEEKRRCRSEKFKEELRRTEAINQFEHLKPVEGDGEISRGLQLEMFKQQELIKGLEEQIEEERRVFEKVQQEEERRTEARCSAAATKLQAAFRGTVVRRWSKKELTKRREEERRRQEERKERERKREREERMKMEWEKERRRAEQEEERHRKEAERRRAEYERAKEQERLRLETERKLEEQRRAEKEEAKRIQDERKRKEEEKQKRMEERRVEEEMRKVQEEEEKKIKEEEKAKRIEDEVKRKEEEELPEGIEERRGVEVRRKVQEEEEKTRKEEEKLKRIEDARKRKDEENQAEGSVAGEKKIKVEEAKRFEDERKRKDEEKQKEMVKRRVEDERKRKEVEEAKKNEDERKKRMKRKEEEKQIVTEIRRVKEEEERKEVEEAKRAEDERQRKEEEDQKRMEERRVEEEMKTKEEEEEKRTGSEIKDKEGDEKQKRMNRLQQKEQLKQNEIEQMQKEQRKKLKGKNIKGEEIVMMRNDDGQNTEERSRDMIKDNVKGLDQREKNAPKWGKDEKTGDSVSQLCLSQSVNMSKSFLARTLPPRNGLDEQLSCHLLSTPHTLSTDNSSVRVNAPEENSVTDTRGPQCAQDSSSVCLPDSTEQKRLTWMMSCTPWSKLSMQNKRKGLSAPPRRRRAHRRASGHSLLPLPVDTILTSGPWNSLNQVTSVTLEDLAGCSLCTLSECTRLQSLILRRCKLQAMDGLNQCTELQHIDLQENSISHVDCGGLARLEVLLLGRNQLMSIHGLDDAVNLTVLQLSHNIISRISGLGSLKKLHHLTVDHNQLISTRGLSEAFTLVHLDCSYNHLSHVEGLENCALLNTLDLRGNNLTELPVLRNHVLLRELYLDDNSIYSLHGLDSCWLPLLRWLSVPQNSIAQLPLLVDLVSLKTLNISHNCLSELRNICMSLQGCTHLQELSITDNPVQQENNWRSSVLAVNPSLIKLNGEQTGASGKLSADSTQLWSFQALCQAHQDQIDSVLQRHSMEISSAPSSMHAQVLLGKHATELFQLAEEQRYAHEYGDSSDCETAMQEPVASSCLQELSDRDLTQKKSSEAKTQQPAEHKTLSWEAPHVPNFTYKCQSPSGDHNAGCAGSCISPTQKFMDTQPREDKSSRNGVQASRIDLKTVAVMVIQRRWREHRQRRRTGHLGLHARLSPYGEVKSCKTSPECLNEDYAATVIQAVWRGYALRKKLNHALMLAQISEGDEAFEEVDMDEFIFDEEATERDWITLHSDMLPSSELPFSEQLLLPKPVLPVPELHKSASVQPWKPRQAWITSEETAVSEQSQLPDPSTRMRSPASTLGKYYSSERSEKILEEWGLSSSSTALLMLKRAQRMKARKQQQQRKLLDPAVRLALFRKHNMQPLATAIQRSRPEFREQIKAGRGDTSAQGAPRGEPEQTQTQTQTQTYHRTFQWLQTQAVPSQRSSAPSVSDHFLPEIDPEILNGGRVRLVASTQNRETPDVSVRQWIDAAGFSSPQNHQAQTRTLAAGHAKKEVTSPQKVTLAPSRKERISFRDNPVQLSGGWGGGKKRSNTNNLK